MTKVYASILALGLLGATSTGCKGLPGMECKFNKGEIAGGIQGDAKAFMDAAMDLKKTVEGLDAEWAAEIKATAGDLKIETATEDAVLAKISANVAKLKAEGECTVEFSADLNASASGSADAKGAAGTGEKAKGDAKATGSASASVDVKFDLKCKAEAKVKADLDITVGAIKGHFPKLLGITVKFKELIPKVTATVDAGSKVVGSIKDPMILPEIKCAVEAATGIKASVDVKVSFQASASASAKGEGKADAKG
ncbi:MAG: hypothetical protein ACXWUG_30785 [Polyangiales bacterium]